VERTREQVAAKTSSQQAYSDKAAALADQQHALREARDFKLASAENAIEQARLTVTSDSAKKVAAETDLNVAQRQMARYDTLFLRGLVSRTELEKRLQAWQKAQAEFTAAANKLDISRRSLTNAALAQSTVASEFADKLAKAESERQTALSGEAEARGEVAKLRNQLANNEARTAFHVVRAPQSGRIAQALRSGVGETVKEGSDLLTIVPDDGDLAVEMYVSPMDLPLLQVGNEVRFLFDGWPSIVFAGWPEATYGTFPGEVVAIDQVISENGMYRVVVAPHSEQQPWPEALRAGGGARGIALLQRVPVWYEVWRQLNGFPPDFYAPDPAKSQPKGGQVSKKPQIKIS
jgi:multidrug resistance efflux pump